MAIGPGPDAAIGIEYHIGTTASDPLTDTYTKVGSINAINEYGPQSQDFTFEDLGAGVIKHYTGAQDDGVLSVRVGLDNSDDGQIAVQAANSVTNRRLDYNHKIVYPDARAAQSAVVTVSVASPGVVTWANHGLKAGTKVSFTTTGALPTGLVAATTYYIKTVLDANTFTLSATSGGTVINTSGTQSGVHTLTTTPTQTIEYMKGKVQSFKRAPGSINSVTMASVNIGLLSGSLVSQPRLP